MYRIFHSDFLLNLPGYSACLPISIAILSVQLLHENGQDQDVLNFVHCGYGECFG